ncbi:MAG: hypothetical protein IKC48_04460 [Clostridia bacterium]|nr:hypothetical protein [Clostridia bacterium]
MKKEIFRSACSHLRDYYSLQNPYIITKCYDATDKTFKNHDVCIFVAGDELRITTDIVQGFLHGKRDLGCYAFKRDEITLTKLYRDNLLMAHLQAGDFIFLLGYRAKGFIQKNFIQKSKNMFVPCLQRKGSAYYEFQYCKKKGSPKRLANKGYRHWAKDSIVVHVDEGDAFFDSYLGYLECTNAPNGTTQFSECGVNYYTKEQARCMEEKIKEDKPKDFEALIEWLDKAATDYNGFFFLGL